MRAEKSEQSIFHEENNTFSLTVALNDNKLTLALKDFVDWIVYEKEYTDKNYCKEIHKKMDLVDVYTAFSKTKVNATEAESMQQSGGVRKLKNCELGSVVEHEGNPCYKIEKGGNVTVYFGVTNKKTKKEVIYQSNLRLDKVRNMAKMEILGERAKIEKMNIFKGLKGKMLARITNLEDENIKLKQQMKTFKEQQNEQNQRFEQKFIQLSINNQQPQKVTKQTLVPEQLSSLEPSRTQKMCTAPQAHSSCFRVDGFNVQYITGYQWTQFIFNMPISHNEPTKFKLRVTHMPNYTIMIGVVDYARQKDQRYSHGSANAMCYTPYGHKYPQATNEGEGFRLGDFVEVNVDRSASVVRYIVNGKLKATQTNSMLNDSQRVLMPYVEMYTINDAVEWVI